MYGSRGCTGHPGALDCQNCILPVGGINGYSTFEHGLLQGEPSIITSKWGFWHPNG
eukprot:COSAG01_NODE_67512_length_266_cov_65.658683_1_plen_55_part_01